MIRAALFPILFAAVLYPAKGDAWAGFYMSRPEAASIPDFGQTQEPGARQNPEDVCLNAILAAEQAHSIPGNLLAAIGFQEAGRVVAGRMVIWPWTINAEGAGFRFDGKAEAVARVRRLEAQGVVSIDTGCLQINRRWHPHAFPSLEAAFDPAHNADYAARFLSRLRAETGSWRSAAAAYHSRTPEYAARYLRGLDNHIAALASRLVKTKAAQEPSQNTPTFVDPVKSQEHSVNVARGARAAPSDRSAYHDAKPPSGPIWGASMDGRSNSTSGSLFGMSRATPLYTTKTPPLY